MTRFRRIDPGGDRVEPALLEAEPQRCDRGFEGEAATPVCGVEPVEQLGPGDPGFEELMAEYQAFGELVEKLGVMRAGARLQPTTSATTVRTRLAVRATTITLVSAVSVRTHKATASRTPTPAGANTAA